MTLPNTCPIYMFREFVAQRLQKAPFGWVGEASYQLARRYGDLVEEYHEYGYTVDDTAAAVHKLHMSRPQTVSAPTRASLEQAGCIFND